jgi:hypothetical protein
LRKTLLAVLAAAFPVVALGQTPQCVFTPEELGATFGVRLAAGVEGQDMLKIAFCNYAVVGSPRPERVQVRIESRMNAERFAQVRKSRVMVTGKEYDLPGVGDEAFSNGGMYAARKGAKYVEIGGFRTAAKRVISREEGIKLLKLALERI